MTLSLPQEKLCAITTTAKEVLQIRETSLQISSTLLGWMNNASQTGLWIAPLYYRSLQRDHMHQSTALIQQPLTIDKDSTLSIKLRRTSLVGVSQHLELQWPTITNIRDRDDRLNRCILTGLGGNLARDNNRRPMASRRSTCTGTHQSSGTKSSVSGAISLIQVSDSSTTR